MGGASAHLGKGGAHFVVFLLMLTGPADCLQGELLKKKPKKQWNTFFSEMLPDGLHGNRKFFDVSCLSKLKKKVCRQKSCLATAATSRSNTAAVLPFRWWNLQEFTLNPWLNIYSALKVLPIWIQSNALLFPPKADYLWIFGLTSEPKGLKQFT